MVSQGLAWKICAVPKGPACRFIRKGRKTLVFSTSYAKNSKPSYLISFGRFAYFGHPFGGPAGEAASTTGCPPTIPRWASYSTGSLLLEDLLRASFDADHQEFDFSLGRRGLQNGKFCKPMPAGLGRAVRPPRGDTCPGEAYAPSRWCRFDDFPRVLPWPTSL